MNARLCWSRPSESKIMATDAGGKYKGDSRKLLCSTFRMVPFLFFWGNIEFLSIGAFILRTLWGIKKKNVTRGSRFGLAHGTECIVLACHGQIYLPVIPFPCSETQIKDTKQCKSVFTGSLYFLIKK